MNFRFCKVDSTTAVMQPTVDFLICLFNCVQTKERFYFMPNDPTLTTKLNVEFKLIKGAFVCSFSLHNTQLLSLAFLTLTLSSLFSGHKSSKECSSKQALLNLTQAQVRIYVLEKHSTCEPFILRLTVFFLCLVKSRNSRLIPVLVKSTNC